MSDLNDVSFKLGQMDGKLDQLLKAMAAHIEADDKKHAEADNKISSLERSRAWTIGAGAAIAFVVSAISNIGSFK
jgi:hypothetical protein